MQHPDWFNTLSHLPNTEKMPALFIGHGSPMNAIENNVFTQNMQAIAKLLPKPQAILSISAHWQAKGSWLTAMQQPRTIHDFYGFPPSLYNMQYPAIGHPTLASDIATLLTQQHINNHLDKTEWGLDHGTWSVLVHLYPKADIPVVQLSLDYFKTPQAHYDLGKLLAPLRQKGVLILGSGNIVHNLRLMNPHHGIIYGHDWALEADQKITTLVHKHHHSALIDYNKLGAAVQTAIPTPEHYLPLLYVLAQQQPTDHLHIFNNQATLGSVTMTSVVVGNESHLPA